MEQLKRYTVFLNEKGDLIVVIPFIADSQPAQPKILYDGGQHALFFRTPDNVIIMDYLNEAAQIVLKQAGKILLFEVDLEKQSIVSDYFVPVVMCEKLPTFELEEVAAEQATES